MARLPVLQLRAGSHTEDRRTRIRHVGPTALCSGGVFTEDEIIIVWLVPLETAFHLLHFKFLLMHISVITCLGGGG